MSGKAATITTTDADRHSAGEGAQALSRLLSGHDAVSLRSASGQEEIVLPEGLVRLLHELLEHVAEGQSFTVRGPQSEFTTSEAAVLLGVSRPHLVMLLETGQIAFRRVGGHRRVDAVDLLRYREEHKAKRLAVLTDLQADAQELNMGYDE